MKFLKDFFYINYHERRALLIILTLLVVSTTMIFIVGSKETMPSDEKKDSIKEVQSVSVLSDSGNIRLTWQASEGVDHYNVYRLKDGAPEKLAEVKSPEYIKKGELWKSYTFRISAVNSEGNESELSDPVGIVVTPSNEVSE